MRTPTTRPTKSVSAAITTIIGTNNCVGMSAYITNGTLMQSVVHVHLTMRISTRRLIELIGRVRE